MRDTRTHAFIDESGSPDLSEAGHYVITAVVCGGNSLVNNLAKLQEIRDRHCSGAPLKSSRTGSNADLRKAIIGDLAKLDVWIYTAAILKDRIDRNSGLRFRQSMYKYCQRRLFDRIYRHTESISVVADTFGRKDFMESFRRYLDEHFEETIFSDKEFAYATPLERPMIQVSDFIGGSIRRFSQGDDSRDVVSAIFPRVRILESWPSVPDVELAAEDEALDENIKRHSYGVALRLIDSELEPILKECCSYLALDCLGDGEFVYGGAILNHLKRLGLAEEDRDKDWLMHNVIAKLRDKGAIIVACRDGYKIPESRSDVKRFTEFVAEKTVPYLDRLQRMQESLFLGTSLQYDLAEDCAELKRFLKVITPNEV